MEEVKQKYVNAIDKFVDLFQENRNRDIKEMIKSMGSNKTDKAIGRACKASSGIRH